MSKEQRRVVKFAIVGGSGVVVNQLVVWLVGELVFGGAATSLARSVSLAGGIGVSIFTNFVINDGWTWGDRVKGSGAHWFRRCALFYLSNGVGAALQWTVASTAARLIHLEEVPFGLGPDVASLQLASLIGIVLATPLNYVVNHKLTFRDAGRG